ncbi:DUF423 domain-containing protein [Massilia sp. 9096]|uniref:DUF423 domain-containing protein n=1 Tax=Massilia sp. 9096 TaxID=1500894 RepID=UPI0009DE9073|nr:DUF423 domain-containing protein [Massilia sp. 9096]
MNDVPELSTNLGALVRFLIGAGAVSALIGVALGAFGAHGLKKRLTPDMLAVFEIGVRYQLYHALALVALGAALPHLAPAPMRWAGILLVAGTVVFSGSLYVLALSGRRWLGAVTPFGGLALLAGWACVIRAAAGA